MHYIVEEIEFNFDDWYERNWDNPITEEDQKFITENAVGLWFIESACEDIEDELIEKITNRTGWGVKSIKFCENRPHALTSFM